MILKLCLKRVIVTLFVVLPMIVSAQSISDSYQKINNQWELESEPGRKLEFRIMLDLTYVFFFEEKNIKLGVPEYLDSLNDSYESPADWKNFCFGAIHAYYSKGDSMLHSVNGRLIDHTITSAGDIIKTGKYQKVNLAPLFRDINAASALMNGIMEVESVIARKKANALRKKFEDNRMLYQRKYEQGTRSRNILQYYADSGLSKYMEKQPKELHDPPNQTELILISKPQVTFATNSLNSDGLQDKNNMYLMCKLVGMDWYNSEFTSYKGISIFSSIAMNEISTEVTYLGVEGHFSNMVVFGIGSNSKNSKFFITIPIIFD